MTTSHVTLLESTFVNLRFMSQVTSSDSQLNLATYIERFKRQLVALVMEVYRMRLNTWAIALPGNSKKMKIALQVK